MTGPTPDHDIGGIHGRCFAWLAEARVSIEVFDPPFFQRTRDLANGCFAAYDRSHSHQELNWDTPGGDVIAERLLREACLQEIRRTNDCRWAEEVEAIRDAIPPGNALAFLYGLAWDGGGRRPLGALFGWDDKLVQLVRSA